MSGPRWAFRALALLSLAAATTLLPAARAGGLEMPRPRTLFEVDGSIAAFAQDGDRVAWADESAPCAKSVMLRRISGGSAVPLLSPRGPVCGGVGPEGSLHGRMALAGTRALWAYDYASNQAFNYTLFSGRAGGRERRIGEMSYEGGIEGGGSVPALDLAGDGRELAYEDGGVYRITDRARLVGNTDGTSGLALDRGRLAVARNVGAVEVGNGSPEWSPDGRSIAFLTWTRVRPGWESEVRRQNLVVVDADGTHRRALTVTGDVQAFEWSPDGRSFILERYVDYKPVFFVRPAGRGSARRLASAREAAWSPDGQTVLVTRDDGVYVVPAAGGAGRRVAREGESAAWSPDGRSVAFVDKGRILVVSAEGGTARQLGQGDDPQWSPAGHEIGYVSRSRRLYVVDTDGGSQRRVGSLNVAAFRWSPDAGRIAYVNQIRSELRVVGQDGADEARLASFDRRRLTGELDWSADSVRVAYTRWRADGNTYALDVVAASGDSARTVAVASADDVGGRTWSLSSAVAYVDAKSREIALIAFDGSGGRLLTKTPGAAEERYSVEVRRMPSGVVASSFDVKPCWISCGSGCRVTRLPQVFGLSGSRIAVGLGCPDAKTSRAEIRSLDGRLVRKLAVTSEARSESFSGRWLVFRVARTVFGVDIRSGTRYVLARTELPIVGLSIEGRRVAWAEAGPGKRSRIVALTLPR